MPERRVVIDHFTLGVSDLERSRRFYAQALAPLGFRELGSMNEGRDVSFGPESLDDFAISEEYATGGQVHIAFAADSREQVDAFHEAALAAGATDNGARGPR